MEYTYFHSDKYRYSFLQFVKKKRKIVRFCFIGACCWYFFFLIIVPSISFFLNISDITTDFLFFSFFYYHFVVQPFQKNILNSQKGVASFLKYLIKKYIFLL